MEIHRDFPRDFLEGHPEGTWTPRGAAMVPQWPPNAPPWPKQLPNLLDSPLGEPFLVKVAATSGKIVTHSIK